jgi:hypothetical protein
MAASVLGKDRSNQMANLAGRGRHSDAAAGEGGSGNTLSPNLIHTFLSFFDFRKGAAGVSLASACTGGGCSLFALMTPHCTRSCATKGGSKGAPPIDGAIAMVLAHCMTVPSPRQEGINLKTASWTSSCTSKI